MPLMKLEQRDVELITGLDKFSQFFSFFVSQSKFICKRNFILFFYFYIQREIFLVVFKLAQVLGC